MRCPTCGEKTRVLETRSSDHGHETRRRQVCPHGHVRWSIEVFESGARGRSAAASFRSDKRQRANAAERRRWTRKLEIERLRKEGLTLAEISAKVHIGKAQVGRILNGRTR